MRIAMLGTKGVPAASGGIEKYIEEVGSRLVRRGHAVTVFGSRWYLCKHRADSHLGMQVRRIPSLNMQATDALMNTLFATLDLLWSPIYDIVHVHGYASYLCVPLLKKRGLATVLTAHGVDSGWDNPKYGAVARRVLQQCFAIGLRQADAVTTVAHHLQSTINERYAVSAQVLPSGIDQACSMPPAIIAEKYGLEGGDFILFLGRIDPIKRVDWLLDLAQVIPPGMRVVIAGGAQNQATQAYLDGLTRRAEPDKRIIFSGPVYGQEKHELLGNCRLFVAPSLNEGLPITVIEAASHGRCVLASDIKAHAEIIRDGVSGCLFPAERKEVFLASVRRLCAEPAGIIDAIGAQARQSVQNTFTWEATAHGFESIYRRLIHADQ